MGFLTEMTVFVDSYVSFVKYPFFAASTGLIMLFLHAAKPCWRQMCNNFEIVKHCSNGKRRRLRAVVVQQSGSVITVVHKPIVGFNDLDSKHFDLEIFGVLFPHANVKDLWIQKKFISKKRHIWFRPVGENTGLMLKADILYRPGFSLFKKSLNIALIKRGSATVQSLPKSAFEDSSVVDLHLALKSAELIAQNKSIALWKTRRRLGIKQSLTNFFTRRQFSTAKMDLSVSGLELKLNSSELLSPSHVEVTDTSGGCGASFYALVVSDKFTDLKLLQRHRLVNETLAQELKEIHAFQIKAVTVEEYEKLKRK